MADPAVLISARIAPDMMSLAGQIQRASDKAKNGVARLSGIAAPMSVDTETTFEDLRLRIFKTVTYLETIAPEDLFEGAVSRLELSFQSFTGKMNGEDYLTKILLPDSYFILLWFMRSCAAWVCPLGRPTISVPLTEAIASVAGRS